MVRVAGAAAADCGRHAPTQAHSELDQSCGRALARRDHEPGNVRHVKKVFGIGAGSLGGRRLARQARGGAKRRLVHL